MISPQQDLPLPEEAFCCKDVLFLSPPCLYLCPLLCSISQEDFFLTFLNSKSSSSLIYSCHRGLLNFFEKCHFSFAKTTTYLFSGTRNSWYMQGTGFHHHHNKYQPLIIRQTSINDVYFRCYEMCLCFSIHYIS